MRRYVPFLGAFTLTLILTVLLASPSLAAPSAGVGSSALWQATASPPDPLANWNGNPNSPTYDGRLNPHAAEYYTVYCRNDFVTVFRADGLLLRSIPITSVMSMNAAGSTVDLGDRMTLARSNDSITIGGFNGNAAPAYGSKLFSLRACLSANGRTPSAVPTQRPTPTATPLPGGSTAVVVNPPGACTHVVQAGETAYHIAQCYRITVNQLAQANGGVNLNALYAGQRLTLPICGGVVVPVVTTPLPTPGPGARVHVVQAGENLFRISLRYGRTVAAIAAANGIADVRRIYIGQRLVIP